MWVRWLPRLRALLPLWCIEGECASTRFSILEEFLSRFEDFRVVFDLPLWGKVNDFRKEAAQHQLSASSSVLAAAFQSVFSTRAALASHGRGSSGSAQGGSRGRRGFLALGVCLCGFFPARPKPSFRPLPLSGSRGSLLQEVTAMAPHPPLSCAVSGFRGPSGACVPVGFSYPTTSGSGG